MYRPRLIPCLLLDGKRLVKTIQFSNSSYVGDPINTVKIFNEKEVDELIVLDIQASKNGNEPNFEMVAQLASECFMPICYGGGIRSLEDAERLIASGVEKIALNTAALQRPALVGEIARRYGSQSVVVGIDVSYKWWRGYRVLNSGKRKITSWAPADWAKRIAEEGAGEILLNSVDRDGTMKGYDSMLIQAVAKSVSIPVIACGGASDLNDCKKIIRETRASAVAAGALFVYKGPHRAVLINYPNPIQLQELFA
ncbi:MAG: AglZ/HisF2 family acetamidino modification protein [Pseudomonadota bacterium]